MKKFILTLVISSFVIINLLTLNVFAATDDHGNDRYKAYPFTSGIYTKIETGGDNDCFYFTATETALYRFYTTGNMDTYGILQNDIGVYIAEDDDSGSGLNFELVYALKKGEKYYINVKGAFDSTTGTTRVFMSKLSQSQYSKLKWSYPYRSPKIAKSISTRYTKGVHNGIDITTSGVKGYPIYSVISGIVQYSDYDNLGGNMVVILNSDGTTTRYLHMLKKPLVVVKQHVTSGTILGYTGSTGSSTGNHLHFDVNLTNSKFSVSGSKTIPTINPIYCFPQIAFTYE